MCLVVMRGGDGCCRVGLFCVIFFAGTAKIRCSLLSFPRRSGCSPDSSAHPPFSPHPTVNHLQGRSTNPALERGEAEELFREHVQGLYKAALEVFLDLLDKEIQVCACFVGEMSKCCFRGAGAVCGAGGVPGPRGGCGGKVTLSGDAPASAPAACMPGPDSLSPPACPPLQPLVPPREQEEATGLPRPLLRYRDAEPLLEDDPRFGRMPEEYR